MFKRFKSRVGFIIRVIIEAQDAFVRMEAGAESCRTPGDVRTAQGKADNVNYESGRPNSQADSMTVDRTCLDAPESLDEAVAMYKARGIIEQIGHRKHDYVLGPMCFSVHTFADGSKLRTYEDGSVERCFPEGFIEIT